MANKKGQTTCLVKILKKGRRNPLTLLFSETSFAEVFVTTSLCEKVMKKHCNNNFKPKNKKVFLKVVKSEISKKASEEVMMSLSGVLSWKTVNKSIKAEAATWFKAKQKDEVYGY
jgi:hypothetical protein